MPEERRTWMNARRFLALYGAATLVWVSIPVQLFVQGEYLNKGALLAMSALWTVWGVIGYAAWRRRDSRGS